MEKETKLDRMIREAKLRRGYQEPDPKPERPKPSLVVDPEFSKRYKKRKIKHVVPPGLLPDRKKEVAPVPDKPIKFERPKAEYSNHSPYGIASDYILHPDKYKDGTE